MKDNFIKGYLYKEIYRNEMNGYMVGLFKIKDNNIDYDDDIIHIQTYLSLFLGEYPGENFKNPEIKFKISRKYLINKTFLIW